MLQQVDPDCVFFPARLRGHVHNFVGQNVFFLKLGETVDGRKSLKGGALFSGP